MTRCKALPANCSGRVCRAPGTSDPASRLSPWGVKAALADAKRRVLTWFGLPHETRRCGEVGEGNTIAQRQKADGLYRSCFMALFVSSHFFFFLCSSLALLLSSHFCHVVQEARATGWDMVHHLSEAPLIGVAAILAGTSSPPQRPVFDFTLRAQRRSRIEQTTDRLWSLAINFNRTFSQTIGSELQTARNGATSSSLWDETGFSRA